MFISEFARAGLTYSVNGIRLAHNKYTFMKHGTLIRFSSKLSFCSFGLWSFSKNGETNNLPSHLLISFILVPSLSTPKALLFTLYDYLIHGHLARELWVYALIISETSHNSYLPLLIDAIYKYWFDLFSPPEVGRRYERQLANGSRNGCRTGYYISEHSFGNPRYPQDHHES